MKLIYILTSFATLTVVVIGLLNLISMFDEENCVCLNETNQCQIYSEIENPKARREYQRICEDSSCKYFFGNCFKLHKFLDITYVIRGR